MFKGIECTVERGPDGPLLVKTATTPASQVRLAWEADRLRQAAHPGVVELLEQQTHRLLLAWAGGQTLATVVAPLPQAAAILASLSATVADLHEMGIVHGALEPSHVLVGLDNRPRLCGFGASGPEHAAGPTDDVAAIGALIDSLVGSGAEIEPIPERRWGRRSWSGYHRRALQTIADQATQHDPARRPTARAVAAAIAEAVPDARLGPVQPLSTLSEPPGCQPPPIPPTVEPLPDLRERERSSPAADAERDPRIRFAPEDQGGRDDQRPEAPMARELPRRCPGATRRPSEPTSITAPTDGNDGRAVDDGPPPEHRIDVASTSETRPTGDEGPVGTIHLPTTLMGMRIEEVHTADDADHGSPIPRRLGTLDRPILSSTRRRPRPAMIAASAACVALLLGLGGIASRRPGSSGTDRAGVSSPDDPPTSVQPSNPAPTPTAPSATDPVSIDGSPCPRLSGNVADVDQDGCDEAVRVEGAAVVAGPHRFAVGEAGDQLVVGDWNCDGSATPAALRPSTGEVFVFESWGSLHQPTTVDATTVIPGARSIEASNAATCTRLTVRLTDGAARTVSVREGVR